jgi:hypothetical protein
MAHYRFKGGELLVNTPPGLDDLFQAEEKPVPDALKSSGVDWVGNFGFLDKNTRKPPIDPKNKKPLRNLQSKYQAQVKDRPGKKLVYHDGSQVVQVTDSRLTNGYRSFDLDLADPPIGWTN